MIFEPGAKTSNEVAPLIPFGAEPRERRVSEHPVENHQTLNSARNWDRLTVTVVSFTNRGIERLVLDMEDPGPLLTPERRGRGESLGQQLLDEVVHLLAMSDAREGAVLAADKYTRVQHHRDQEAGLAIGEAERQQRIDTVGVGSSDIRTLWSLSVHHSLMNAV